MSDIRSKFPLDHRVFRGGRYLEAFASLDDIDHFELLILLYLGSKMPFDKGFVGQVAFPSVATISRQTKIPESTLRKKIKSLVKKGYLIKNERILMNERGHWQQSSNDYIITNESFEEFERVQSSRQWMQLERKRAVGQSEVHNSMIFSPDSPPPCSANIREAAPDPTPLSPSKPNSSRESSLDALQLPPSSSHSASSQSLKNKEVEGIFEAWEEVTKKPVSLFERRRFLETYVRTRSREVSILEKIDQIDKDAYLHQRAASINWLFQGFDIALRNRDAILAIGSRAIDEAQTKEELANLSPQLPDLIQKRSFNFIASPEALVENLFGHKLNKARRRLGIKVSQSHNPKNSKELKIAITQRLQSTENLSQENRKRLKLLLESFAELSFPEMLKLYEKYGKETS